MSVRIDKWLWSVRLFKTRSMAADACKSNRILVNDSVVKASRDVKVGDEVSVRKMPIVYRFKVVELIANRQPARNVPLYMHNITPPEELQKLEMAALTGAFMQRDRGAGRPTKRDRREIEDVLEGFTFGEDSDDSEDGDGQ